MPTTPIGRWTSSHNLAASLSHVETRRVSNDYTIQLDAKLYQIARQDIRTGLRGPACGWRSGGTVRWQFDSAIAT